MYKHVETFIEWLVKTNYNNLTGDFFTDAKVGHFDTAGVAVA